MQEKRLEHITNINKGDSANVKKVLTLLNDVRDYWHWLTVSLVFSVAFGLLYLRYNTPQFLVKASILVRDDAKGSEFGDAAFLESMGLSSMQSSVDNEIEILKSRTLMESVVEDLQLNVRYYSTGRVKTTELFKNSPFRLRFVSQAQHSKSPPGTYVVTIGEKGHYKLQLGSQTFTGVFGDSIALPHGHCIVYRTSHLLDTQDQHSIVIQDRQILVDHYRKALTIAATNKFVSTVNLSLTDAIPAKGEAILDRLLRNYFKASIHDKNRVADSTIAFINQNLNQVSVELTDSEKAIERFQSLHHITDLSENVRQLLNQSAEYGRDKSKYEVQARTVDSLLQFLHANPQHIIPTQLLIQDQGFLSIVEKYNATQLALTNDLVTMHESHPNVLGLKAQLNRLRQDLIANLNAQHGDLRIGMLAMSSYNDEVQREIKLIPAVERLFFEAKRQQQIKQELYILLLKKGVETSISRSSTFANARIIDKPKAGPEPVKPNKQLVMLMSGFIGIGLPLAIIHLRHILNTKVTGKHDLADLLNISLLAEISHNYSLETSIYSHSQSPIAEQFRVLRTNVQFLSAPRQNQVILLTSSMGGEGKSFIAVNLCGSLALTNKKVLLLELDLRRPRLAKDLMLKEEGFTNYILSDVNFQEYIQHPSSKHPFAFITAGSVPPNPAELLGLPKVDQLINSLKTRYDYIVLDTPPIGLVTDASLLSHLADMSLYVVRQQFTFKSQLEIIKDIQDAKQLPRMHLILNDTKEIPGYSYGYYRKEKRHLFNAIRRKS
ncbi:GumC family protein [Dyadobacter chenhuakuii]|uniref:non-specific protein-tyrosine kinase n=1 Tax=Dyadobacter chenhuakuii TaxID=2909339 RepID=A0ABY4XJ64_9BACT|nr:tyrosine-protein kinase family protein [Dyadobacter chenhuakuii]MCF2496208.1 polysaccharide biosynthesis tyrosine autokinase [Dyadobacter chenhuakuii]USJ30271.1 polysaccharide biosynthesis tyrosine autokinase [Dyadobacter chenhuakuii]